MRSRHLLLPLLLLLVLAAGCGTRGDGPAGEAELALDAAPSAVHAGIYLAVRRGFTDAEGVDLTVRAPDEDDDPVELLREDRAQFAVMPIETLARAREDGADLVAVMSLVQRPLRGVLAPEGTTRAQLRRARIAVGPSPGSRAVLTSGFPRARRVATPTPLRTLLAGDVDAAVARFDVAAADPDADDLELLRTEDLGAPAYPELVLVCRKETTQDERGTVQATVTALRRGYREVVLGPEEAVGVLVEAVDDLERVPTQAQLDAVLPAFTSGGPFGRLDLARLGDWAEWAQRTGAIGRAPDLPAMVNPAFAMRGTISG